jgi:hypothetical protein
MKRSRITILAIVFLGVAALSGAQDYGYWSNSELRAELAYSTSPHQQIKLMKVLSMRGDEQALNEIIELLDSPFHDVRLNSLRSLVRYHETDHLDYFEDVIFDQENQYTVQERMVVIKGYVTIEGWDPEVLEYALDYTRDRAERNMLKKAIKSVYSHDVDEDPDDDDDEED